MYLNYNIVQTHHLFNKFKKTKVIYEYDRKEYSLSFFDKNYTIYLRATKKTFNICIFFSR